MLVKNRFIVNQNVVWKVLPQQGALLYAQHPGQGQVGLPDEAPVIQGDIADRGQIVQVGIPLLALGQGLLRLPQRLILHFQFDLVNLEFIDQLL